MSSVEMISEFPRLLSRRQAAAAVGINIRTLDAFVREGLLPAVRLRRRILIDASDLKHLLDSRKSLPVQG